jgi:cell shape-determining protein MreC
MDNSDALIERPKMQELIDKLEEIQLGFRQNLNSLHQKLELLDSRHDLQNSLESLRKNALTRVSDLEVEVKRLRDDLKSIRELLGLDLDQYNSGRS